MTRWLVWATVLAVGSGGGAEGDPSSEAITEREAIQTAAVEAASWRPEAEVTGSLEPIASVQLGFDIPGRLKSVLVPRGATVQTGDALATLDRAIAGAQLAQAEAGLAGAKAGADAAATAWKRLEAVGNAVSEQQRTEVSAQLQAAQAQLEQARAGAQLARTQLSYTTLRAPIAGVVTQGPDNAGALVGAGMPLFVIEDLSALRLKGTAPESESWLAEGLSVTVYPGAPGATEGVPAVVERVLPSLDPATRRVPIEIRVDAPPSSLRAHAFARAVVQAGSDESVWAIPRGALVAQPDFSVFVVTDTSAAPTRVPVAVLREAADRVLVRGALTAGAQVVVNPPHGYGG